MKKCVYCGLENADDAVMCTICHTEFVSSPTASRAVLRNEYLISPEEWRFWNRMTFRQFGVVIVRLAALWCFFEAALEATAFIQYMMLLYFMPRTITFTYPLASQFAAPIVRIGFCVVAGFVLFFRPERVLSWLVRGAVLRQPREISPSKAASGPPE